MLSTEYEELKHGIEKGHKTVMDSYGGSDLAEFFAVATECFFEKPRQLLKKHPNLYAELKQFYRQDPAAWCCEPPEGANQTGASLQLSRQIEHRGRLAPIADFVVSW